MIIVKKGSDRMKESLKMTVKLKRGNEIKEIDIVIAPDFFSLQSNQRRIPSNRSYRRISYI